MFEDGASLHFKEINEKLISGVLIQVLPECNNLVTDLPEPFLGNLAVSQSNRPYQPNGSRHRCSTVPSGGLRHARRASLDLTFAGPSRVG